MVIRGTAAMMITQILDKARVWIEGTMTEEVCIGLGIKYIFKVVV